jgi:hypothetical protein
MIKYGSIEYFKLLELKSNISGYGIDKLDLENMNKLRLEVDIKLKASEDAYNDYIRKSRAVSTNG